MKHTTMQSYAGRELCPRCGVDANGNTWPDCTNGHPHAETCAKQNIGENLCARCERELNTQLPTSGVLSGKTEWVVRKAGRYAWCAHRKGELPDTKGFFPTWGEALAYADQQARQVTVTLPPTKPGDHVVAGKGLYSLHVNHRAHCTDVMLGGWDGVTVENNDLEALALYLLALAKKRECA